MLYDSYQRRLIIDRCWLIYDLITETFAVPHQFHIDFPLMVEVALISGYLQVLVEISRKGHLLHIHEEYDFRNHELVIRVYSYNLLHKSKHNIIRADPLPHYRVDYRRRKLAHFPHHLHEEKGRICSFSGQIEDFVKRVAAVLESESQN
ncbi:hypothetical protein ISS37_00295 [candidate division KSB1 bacterium]|nr:hypothetical protein [candidate division KSB1 bacterium]